MTLFDELTMPPQFRMMKLMLPYTPATTRPMLAILIKFMELQHTIRLFSENPNALSPSQDSLAQGDTAGPQGFSLHMIEEILPYLAPQERDMFENMKNMMGMMEMMQMMQEMQGMQESQEMPETDDPQETAGAQEPRGSQGENNEHANGTPPAGDFGFSGDAARENAAQASTGMAFSGLNPMDLLQNMLSPKQQEMFRTYQNIFESEGGDSHE
jgi:hypothetical protein